jgi:hypothetical protein
MTLRIGPGQPQLRLLVLIVLLWDFPFIEMQSSQHLLLICILPFVPVVHGRRSLFGVIRLRMNVQMVKRLTQRRVNVYRLPLNLKTALI